MYLAAEKGTLLTTMFPTRLDNSNLFSLHYSPLPLVGHINIKSAQGIGLEVRHGHLLSYNSPIRDGQA